MINKQVKIKRNYRRFFSEQEINKDKYSHLDKPELIEQLIQFFKENPYPVDDDFHNFAKSIDVDPDDLESYVYAIASCFIVGGNYNKKGADESSFNEDEKAMGIITEAEHVDNENQNPVIQAIATYMKNRVANDHLADNDKYYSQAKEGKLQIEEIKDYKKEE